MPTYTFRLVMVPGGYVYIAIVEVNPGSPLCTRGSHLFEQLHTSELEAVGKHI